MTASIASKLVAVPELTTIIVTGGAIMAGDGVGGIITGVGGIPAGAGAIDTTHTGKPFASSPVWASVA